MSDGKSFHIRASATGKSRCPTVGSLTAGTSRWWEVEDRSLCQVRPIIYWLLLFVPSVLWCCWLGDRKCMWLVISPFTTLFLCHRDSMVAACCLQVSNTIIVTGGMPLWNQLASSPALQPSQSSWPLRHGGSVLPQSRTLLSFNVLVVLVVDRKGIRFVKVLPQQYPRVCFWGSV